MIDDRSMRRRSPSGRRWSRVRTFADECDSLEQKERCRNKRSVARMFVVGTPFLLLVYIGALFGRKQGSASPPSIGNQGARRELKNTPYRAETPIAEWTMSSSTNTAMTKELLSLKWDKTSLASMETFIVQSKAVATSHLADQHNLWKMLKDLHDNSSPTAVVILNNLPIDPDVPRTPTDGTNTLKKQTYVSEAMLLALGELSGANVVGYSSEVQYSNPWVHEGFPREGQGSALTAAHELSFHQDMSYQDRIPDILGLYCLREGHDTNLWTTLLDVREILARLPDDIVEILRQPRFRIQTSGWVDASWSGADQGRAMLHGYSLHLPVNWENMIGLDPEAVEALVLLQEAIVTTEPHNVHFEPGMIVFFNNQRVVHGRTPYNDLRLDGGDRVVNRAYFRDELTSEERLTRMI